METRYVWLNPIDGKFSNSWDEKTHEVIDKGILDEANENGWKLIKYECINDKDFEFFNKMKLR